MNNIRASIEILFRDICPDNRLDNYFCTDILKKGCISIEDFMHKAFGVLPYYSYDEIENLYQYICMKWSWEDNRQDSYLYQLLYEFAHDVLIDERGQPKVQYEHILRWRDLSHRLGEDLFTCNFLAYQDMDLGRERTQFNWRPVIDSDNTRLRHMLSKGVAENHFHLWGSAPYCDLSWIVLMNNITNQKKRFKDMLKDGLLESTEQINDVDEYHLYFLVLKAAIIRAHFMYLLKQGRSPFTDFTLKELLKGKSNKHEGVLLAARIPAIQKEIELLKFEYGLKYDGYTPDYAVAKNTLITYDNGTVLLSGERWFLYTMFNRLRYTHEDDILNPYKGLFYIYLLCKSKFREELLQVNNKTGFANFSKYQDRKDTFLRPYPFYMKAMASMAVRTSQKHQKIDSFETRITQKQIKDISRIDKTIYEKHSDPIDRFLDIEEQKLSDHFYTIHYIKQKEKKERIELLRDVKPRHWRLRDEVKTQTLEIIKLREVSNKEAARIYGIDAASNELYARPEVFATEFRLLQHHQPARYHDDVKEYLKIPPMPRIHATYHAGEDFLDIVDGLRAIDEAIKFLELGEGDRIGHALALGIDVEDYYTFKHNYLLLPKQNLLDNYSWFLSRIVKYGLTQFMGIKSTIEHDFDVIFHDIYHGVKDRNGNGLHYDAILYYQAWTLRGDHPDLYITGNYRDERLNFTLHDKYTRAKYPNQVIRQNTLVLDYLCTYQFNSKVKERGEEIIEFKVSPNYIKAVKAIQKEMQMEVAKKNIAIECNPSSNVLIGTFKRYDKHPIVNFFNIGLTNNPEKQDDCPKLMVSINTDDQGVFNTYLENEYALIAKALEKAKDKDGNLLYNSAMIYDWLEKVRQMGLEMSFRDNN